MSKNWKKIIESFAALKKSSTFALAKRKGAIAQLVEQRTENPCVPGSIPGGTTLEKESCSCNSLFCYGISKDMLFNQQCLKGTWK